MSHTKGPWEIERFSKKEPPYLIAPAHGADVICQFNHERTRNLSIETQEANALLIAAAPDLLQELKNISNAMRKNFDDAESFRGMGAIEGAVGHCQSGGEVMMTVEEASIKLCPVLLSEVSGYRYCNADSCMAWRWETQWRKADGSARGFCGLAGKPEEK